MVWDIVLVKILIYMVGNQKQVFYSVLPSAKGYSDTVEWWG